MSLENKTRESIKQHILEKIYYRNNNIVASTSETYNISRTTVNRYLKEMETNGIIERCEEKQYKWQLKETRNSFFIYYPQKDKLEEDRIFETDILPLLKVLPDSVLKI